MGGFCQGQNPHLASSMQRRQFGEQYVTQYKLTAQFFQENLLTIGLGVSDRDAESKATSLFTGQGLYFLCTLIGHSDAWKDTYSKFNQDSKWKRKKK